jgi:hypothetical protein
MTDVEFSCEEAPDQRTRGRREADGQRVSTDTQ